MSSSHYNDGDGALFLSSSQVAHHEQSSHPNLEVLTTVLPFTNLAEFIDDEAKKLKSSPEHQSASKNMETQEMNASMTKVSSAHSNRIVPKMSTHHLCHNLNQVAMSQCIDEREDCSRKPSYSRYRSKTFRHNRQRCRRIMRDGRSRACADRPHIKIRRPIEQKLKPRKSWREAPPYQNNGLDERKRLSKVQRRQKQHPLNVGLGMPRFLSIQNNLAAPMRQPCGFTGARTRTKEMEGYRSGQRQDKRVNDQESATSNHYHCVNADHVVLAEVSSIDVFVSNIIRRNI